MIIMTLIFAIYALITNIVASTQNNSSSSSYIPADLLAISLGAKQKNKTSLNETFYFIQAWLGVALLIIWMFTIIILKYL